MLENTLTFVAGLDQNQLIMLGVMALVLLYCVWKLLKPVFEWPLKLLKKIPRPKSRFGLFLWYFGWVIWWLPVTPMTMAGYAAYQNPEIIQEYKAKAHTTYKLVKVALDK